ncbi:MAG: GNAT family N-acetyltransferase [Aquabacterium sp.]
MHLRTARLFVTDLASAHRFYALALQLPLVAGGLDQGWCVFGGGGGIQLVIEPVAPDAPDDDQALVGRFTGLSFTVDDIEARFRELLERDVVFTGAPQRQAWGGILATLRDPSGNELQLVQMPAVAPAPPHTAAALDIAIVPIQMAHAASFRQCLDAVARERRFLAQTEALPLERIEAFVRDSVADDAVQFVALDGSQVVGWADIFPSWAQAVQHVGSLGMGLLPTYRGRGIGQRLLQACIDKAWAQGLARIELEARADNHAAIRLYERCGFVHEAVKPRGLCFDGVYFDAVQMRLLKPLA